MAYTDIEQGKQLLALGLDPRTADMFYLEEWRRQGKPIYKEIPEARKSAYPEDDMPCWSIGALLDLMPNATLSRIDEEDGRYWFCNTIQFGYNYFSYDGDYHDSPVDACIEVIGWLVRNGHIKDHLKK